MATVTWLGTARAVAQVNTITPASVGVGNTFTATINGKAVTVTATVATVANVTGLLTAAIALLTDPEWLEVSAVDSTTCVTLTANTPGVPFTQTSSASGGTATNVTATTTASSGPNDWSTALNWSGGSVPVNSDDVYINNNIAIYYGLAQSAVLLTSLTIGETFQSDIGLPLYNASGYSEYRKTRLEIGATTTTTYSGSGRIRIDLGANVTTFNGYNTGSASDVAAFDIKGGASSYTLNLVKGSYAVSIEPGQTATLGTIRMGYLDNVAGDVTLILGSGCTTTTISQEGGDLTMYGGATTVTMLGGTLTTIGAGAFTTINLEGGTLYYRSTGTITTLNIGTNSTADFSQDTRARTVTNCTIQATGTMIDTAKTVTWTNPFTVNRCGLSEVTLDLGTNFAIQRS
jgi:hypothetical protein